MEKTVDRPLTTAEKRWLYETAREEIETLLLDEMDFLGGLATAIAILHEAIPYFFWTGFYRRVGPAELMVGPYQGTPALQRISFSRGICGTAARTGKPLIVPDIYAFPGHLGSDGRTSSEIAVPVFDSEGLLLGVLVVDSTLPEAFDETDAEELARIGAVIATRERRPIVWR